MSGSAENATDARLASLRRRIAAMRGIAFAVVSLERFFILALPALGILSLFLTVSWFGLWRLPSDGLRAILSALFAVAFIIALLRLRSFRWPSRIELDRRLEARSGLAHQAISIQADEPVGNDPFARALWKSHQARMAEKIETIDSGTPSPDIVRHDPHALRAPVVLALVVAWTFSWSNLGGRVSDVFDYSRPAQSASGMRIDAWVTPPSYTGTAPIYLSGAHVTTPQDVVKVPQFSEVNIRVSGETEAVDVSFSADGDPVMLVAEDAEEADDRKPARSDATPATQVFKFKLARDGVLSVDELAYAFSVIPDNKPTIAFDKAPDRAVNGALEISFRTEDDYGVVEAHAQIEPADGESDAVALFDPPTYRLDLPGSGGKSVKATTSRDLTEHPLSGKKVRLTLVAKDAAGLEGRSETREIILPARFFSEPLAGSIAEQRQVFSLDVNKLPRALELSDAAAFRADETIPNLTHFLLLQSTRNRLNLSNDIPKLTETSAYFWDVARFIEDGDLSSAEKRLRDAQDKLSEALKRNASDKEIEKLMAELRQAMKEYLAEMAKRMQNADPNQMAMQTQRMMRAQDFDNMLNQLENLARSGSKDEAQKLLSEMQRMLNNMQTARPRNQQQRNSPMREQIDKLGELMQKQQKLMEDTHRTEQALRDRLQRGDPTDPGEDFESQPPTEDMQRDQQGQNDSDQQQQDGQQPDDKATADELRQALKEMQKRQAELQKDLDALQKKLSEMGLKPMPGFKDAGKEMGESSDALGKSQGQRSADAQGRALEALRKGAGDLMQQLSQAGRNGPQGMPMPGGEQADGNDPLGRRSGQLGAEIDDQVKVPDQIDVQRAREILDAIRRKLGDGPASIIEKEYLERLLDLK